MIIEKTQGSKIMKMTKVAIVDQKMVFCGSKKNYDAERNSTGFFYQRS